MPRRWRYGLLLGVGLALLGVGAGYISGAARTYSVASASMEPTLHCGGGPGCLRLQPDQVLTDGIEYLFRSPARGDIVILQPSSANSRCHDQAVLLKRIVAVGGEAFAYIHGSVFINGKHLRERYTMTRFWGRGNFGPIRIPPNEFFVMGDNRSASCDSREFGPIPRSAILGRVILVYSPQMRLP